MWFFADDILTQTQSYVKSRRCVHDDDCGFQASFNIAVLASIADQKFDYFAQDDFRVRNPDIKITLEGKPVSLKEFSVSVKVENPLPIPLKGGKFYIQGPGLDKQLKIELEEVRLVYS